MVPDIDSGAWHIVVQQWMNTQPSGIIAVIVVEIRKNELFQHENKTFR
jgi:hypothetical protein